MTGPEHYREAERLCAVADSPTGVTLKQDGIDCAALAQVHATLALAAATALPAHVRYYGDDSDADRQWAQVTA